MAIPRKKIASMGSVLRVFREDLKATQEELAYAMGTSASYISMLEHGVRYPSIEMIIRIALALNARPGVLVDKITDAYLEEQENLKK